MKWTYCLTLIPFIFLSLMSCQSGDQTCPHTDELVMKNYEELNKMNRELDALVQTFDESPELELHENKSYQRIMHLRLKRDHMVESLQSFSEQNGGCLFQGSYFDNQRVNEILNNGE